MSLPVTRPILLIDDQEVDFGQVWSHQQDDPFPGGYRYRALIPESLTSRLDKVRRDHLWLDRLFGCWRREQGVTMVGPPLFVLNTIDKVIETDGGIEVQGECSPHCSALPCPYCGSMAWASWLFDHCVRKMDGSLAFTCKDCPAISKVRVDGENLTLSALDGSRESVCRQVGLKHQQVDGAVRVMLGKLKWDLPP